MSGIVEQIMTALKAAQEEHAHASLRAPSEPSAFEYGRVSGIYAGLGKAWQIVQQVISEDADEDDKL